MEAASLCFWSFCWPRLNKSQTCLCHKHTDMKLWVHRSDTIIRSRPDSDSSSWIGYKWQNGRSIQWNYTCTTQYVSSAQVDLIILLGDAKGTEKQGVSSLEVFHACYAKKFYGYLQYLQMFHGVAVALQDTTHNQLNQAPPQASCQRTGFPVFSSQREV